MLKVGLIRTTARRVAIGMAGTGTAGAAALTAYAHTEHGLGFRREVNFWSSVAPVVWDYWWNSFASSPKVKAQATAAEWRHRRKSAQSVETTTAEGAAAAAEEAWEEEQRARKKETMRQLHERNAPKIYDVMLALGGLYVKLGQVLSVTALPIPEQYRDYFRTLQSDVPASDFDAVVRPALERELGAPLEAAFESIDATPCGAASIGQAHRATLKGTREDVIVKVQYPEAKWQVPADIECVGQFLQLCVWFGAVDETAFRLSYDEFSRQFLAELDYEREKENLQAVYASSLDPRAPYLKRGVVVPRAFDDMCTKQVITMTYLPGPKFEEEAKAQLALLGIDTKRGVQSVVKETHGYTASSASSDSDSAVGDEQALPLEDTSTWKLKLSRIVGNFASIDSVFSIVRFGRRIMLWSTAATVKSIQAASILPVVPSSWITWAEERQNTILQAERWGWTQEAVSTLLDVHGYQILNQGLFNADPHPGNIIFMINENNPAQQPKIGLIDYGQVKRLNVEERVKIAKLILSIADADSDEAIADNFRNLGMRTRANSTRFLAKFGRLMFGSFEAKHLDHQWHRALHEEDRVVYFPNELSMVYRTALLLRGLALSLQFNPSVGEEWRGHAEETIRLHGVDKND